MKDLETIDVEDLMNSYNPYTLTIEKTFSKFMQ